MSVENTQNKPPMLRAIIGFIVYLLLVPGSLFIAAGTIKWPMAWGYLILSFGAVIGSRLVVLRLHPDTLQERARFSQAEGTPAWDRWLSSIVAIYGPLISMIVTGLDHRWGWSPSMPASIQWIAFGLVAAGFGFSSWAMIVNRYFSAVVRIQTDRGHKVVKEGPYGWVRHPAYAGSILASIASPLALSALWAYIPVLLSITAVFLRTSLEDKMLSRDLEGYAEYARHETRYRLIPYIW
jgi:protein-S-isoprenylcysteine O-methyltransferase Ste14